MFYHFCAVGVLTVPSVCSGPCRTRGRRLPKLQRLPATRTLWTRTQLHLSRTSGANADLNNDLIVCTDDNRVITVIIQIRQDEKIWKDMKRWEDQTESWEVEKLRKLPSKFRMQKLCILWVQAAIRAHHLQAVMLSSMEELWLLKLSIIML